MIKGKIVNSNESLRNRKTIWHHLPKHAPPQGSFFHSYWNFIMC